MNIVYQYQNKLKSYDRLSVCLDVKFIELILDQRHFIQFIIVRIDLRYHVFYLDNRY